MDFFTAVEARRSVRYYKNSPVEVEKIQKCLDAALLAPNSSNMQCWEFYHVASPEKKKKLQEYCLSQPAASTAPELIVCVARRDFWRKNRLKMIETLSSHQGLPQRALDYYGKLIPIVYTQGYFNIIGLIKYLVISILGIFKIIPRGPCSKQELDLILVKSLALACENIMLAAAAQGLGSCPMEGFDEVRVKKLLNLPQRTSRIGMVISLGYPEEKGIFGKRIRFDSSQFIHRV